MNQDDDDDLKQPPIPLGDLGIILVAAMFLIGFLWLMFGPSPFAGLFDQAKQAPEPPPVVTVTVPPKD
jgi:hypothetical protein